MIFDLDYKIIVYIGYKIKRQKSLFFSMKSNNKRFFFWVKYD